MRADRLEMLKKVMHRWDIDVEAGIVSTRNGVVNTKDKKGYLVISTSLNGKKDKFKVHEVIAVAGGLDILDKTIDHLSGVKLDNRLSNLEAVSSSENVKRATAMGLHVKGGTHGNSILTDDIVREIKGMLGKIPQKDIALMFGVKPSTISDINIGRGWTHVR